LNHVAPDAAAVQTAPIRTATVGTNDQVDEFTTVGKGGKVMQFTPESIFKHLKAVQEARGKKV
jgi:translation initiation factor 3 subunit C